MEAISTFMESSVFKIFVVMFQLFIVVFWFAQVGWTYRDANLRATSGTYWGAVTFFFPVFGLFVYLLLRPPEFAADRRERDLEIKTKQAMLRNSLLNCPACHKLIEKEFLLCPHCRKKLKNECPKCNKALNLSWTICPFCKSQV